MFCSLRTNLQKQVELHLWISYHQVTTPFSTYPKYSALVRPYPHLPPPSARRVLVSFSHPAAIGSYKAPRIGDFSQIFPFSSTSEQLAQEISLGLNSTVLLPPYFDCIKLMLLLATCKTNR